MTGHAELIGPCQISHASMELGYCDRFRFVPVSGSTPVPCWYRCRRLASAFVRIQTPRCQVPVIKENQFFHILLGFVTILVLRQLFHLRVLTEGSEEHHGRRLEHDATLQQPIRMHRWRRRRQDPDFDGPTSQLTGKRHSMINVTASFKPSLLPCCENQRYRGPHPVSIFKGFIFFPTFSTFPDLRRFS